MIRRPEAARVTLFIATTTLLAMVATGAASGAPPKPGPARPAPAVPLAPLPMLPSIPRVKVDVLKAQLVVVEEVNIPRGEWKGEALDFYVAFGAPGAPRAIDAKLVAVGDGALEPEDTDPGEPLVVDRAPRRPASAHPLIGKDTMAGVVVHLKADALTRAFLPGNMAALRLRTALDLPEEDNRGGHGVVIRLGASRGTPLTLGRISLTARPGALPVLRAEAQLCGSEADGSPLAIALDPKPSLPAAAPASPPIAPVLSVRHASDDLCVRYWPAQ